MTGSGAGVLLFGGAFNPPHLTHRRILEACFDQFQAGPFQAGLVERAIVLPAGRHPFKQSGDLAPDHARLELCRLAFGDMPKVEVSDHELQPAHSGYTVDTLRHFARALPGKRLLWPIGEDNLVQFPQWREPREVLRLATLVVVPRPGGPKPNAPDPLNAFVTEEDRIEVWQLNFERDQVSSSHIRELLRTGGDVSAFLAPAVERRIRELGLYGARPR